MSAGVRVAPAQLRVVSTGWDAQLGELYAAPPGLAAPVVAWPSMLSCAGLSGAAQAVTARLHTRITATAAGTRAAAGGYESMDSQAAGEVKTAITTISGTDRRTT
ncbi:hypothetical protein MSM1_07880 [Mycobacterium sp. SM1]|uniref:hypothetical protein n=1 Tax=Mycobacterium sp. SM1 TaxID=2816243 RepID=UPI001BCBCB63|nr:hypothetical protein [Mycobacterium sp. SM1]MBS4728265.1 hypothetical protein [Mycobacterium sp. SM1]